MLPIPRGGGGGGGGGEGGGGWSGSKITKQMAGVGGGK